MNAIKYINGKLVESDNEFNIVVTNETISVLCRGIQSSDNEEDIQ